MKHKMCLRKHRLLSVAILLLAMGLVDPSFAAHASTDDAFIGALAAKGITYESRETAIKSGHLVCQELDQGDAPEQVAQDVMNGSQLDGYHAGYFVGVSIRAYCPGYAAR